MTWEKEFREAYKSLLTPEELEDCILRARESGAVTTAYTCAHAYIISRRSLPPPPPRPERKIPHVELPVFKTKTKTELRVPWQAYSLLFSTLLTAVPYGALAAAFVPPLLYIFKRNLSPFWREGDKVVWQSVAGRVELETYRVETTFKDIHGMGPRDFANALRAFVQSTNGIYYDGREVYVLLQPAKAEETRAALRRIGVVVGEKVEPNFASPKAPLGRYIALAAAHFALLFLDPLAVAPAAFATFFTMLDRGSELRHGVVKNNLLSSLLREDEIHSIAKTSQLSLRQAFIMWREWPQIYAWLQRSAVRSERLAKLFQSQWRMLQSEVLHVIRQRILTRGEKGYLVTGYVNGSSAAFATSYAARDVPALTFDFFEFTPFSLMLLPFQCGAGSVRVGKDDAGRDVCFKFEDLESPHLVIIGRTGSGKTTWAQHIARQSGLRVVAVDPHGHWRGERISAKRYVPPLEVDTDDVDYVLDVLRAAGVAVYDVHYTILYNAVQKCGGRVPLKRLPECLLKTRDITNAWAVDSIYGRLLALAQSEQLRPPSAQYVVIHTEGDTSPSDVMRLITWLYYYLIQAKRECRQPPCPYGVIIAIDEAHILLKHLDALVKAYREIRKFGVVVATMTQSIADVPRDVVDNSGVVAVLAISPTALHETSIKTAIDAAVLERVAVESLPEERVGIIRFQGRAPIFVRLAK